MKPDWRTMDNITPPVTSSVKGVVDQIAPFTRPQWNDAVAVLLGALPTIGGPISTFLSQRQQRAAFDRLAEVLREVDERLARLEQSGGTMHTDEEFAELVLNLAPYISRTRSEGKRRHFALLLSQAAQTPPGAARDEARTMGLLLDSLEYSHVALVQRLMQQPATQGYDGLWGSYRNISVDRTFFSREEGDLLLRLEGVGLLDASELRNSRDRTLGAGGVVVRSLGVRFWNWVSSPVE